MGHHYRQLTQEERYQISALMELEWPQAEIARKLGRDRSTISREVHRNRQGKRYQATTAQRMSDKRRREAAKDHKRIAPLIEWVEKRLAADQWSPEQIAGSMASFGSSLVSHEWIYRHLERDRAKGGKLYLHLRHKRKKYRKRYGSGTRRGPIPNRRDIAERPQVVERRSRIGDWEGDSVVGPGPAALVTLVERKSGTTVIRKVERSTAELTAKAIVSALGPWLGQVKTLTLDNGSEFAHHTVVTEQLGCKVYFARPYHSWERGTNENTNGLIRQYFPKGTDFSKISKEQIQEVEDKLNLRPRKRLSYKAPIELMVA